jgi:hypothetical protein
MRDLVKTLVSTPYKLPGDSQRRLHCTGRSSHRPQRGREFYNENSPPAEGTAAGR